MTTQIDPTLLAQANEAMTQAKILFMKRSNFVFYTTLMFGLDFQWSEDFPTAATNYKWVRFNPKFFIDLPAGQRVFVIFHEIMHAAYMHGLRRMGRDPTKWNYACDYVINQLAKEIGLELWPHCLQDDQYAGMSADEVYDKLPDMPEMEIHLDLTFEHEGDEAEEKDIEKQMKNILVQAAQQSKIKDAPGTIPGDFQVFLDTLLNPKLPMAVLLRRHMTSLAKRDYSMRRPNRRYFPDNYMPTLHSEALGNINWYVDISGSTSDADFLRFVSEAAGAMKHLKPQQLTLISFDTKIQDILVARSVNDMQKFVFHGRGGTLIKPVIDHINETKPQAAVIFTDGGLFDEPEPTKVPLYWCIVGNPNFTGTGGPTIHYET